MFGVSTTAATAFTTTRVVRFLVGSLKSKHGAIGYDAQNRRVVLRSRQRALVRKRDGRGIDVRVVGA